MSAKKAVFLDRDGTINFDPGYIHKPEDVRLLEGAAAGLRLLRPHFTLIVVSNQSGISRGLYTHEDVRLVNERLLELLAAEGASVDAIYYSPYKTADNMPCRKPGTGMFLQAERELGVALAGSWMVGDRSTDIEAGCAIGARTILLPLPPDAPEMNAEPHFRALSLFEAARIILREEGLPVPE